MVDCRAGHLDQQNIKPLYRRLLFVSSKNILYSSCNLEDLLSSKSQEEHWRLFSMEKIFSLFHSLNWLCWWQRCPTISFSCSVSVRTRCVTTGTGPWVVWYRAAENDLISYSISLYWWSYSKSCFILKNKFFVVLQRKKELWWDGRRGRWTNVLKLADKVAELQLWDGEWITAGDCMLPVLTLLLPIFPASNTSTLRTTCPIH